MSSAGELTWKATTADYEREADALLAARTSGSDEARLMVAHRYAFDTWEDLVEFARAVERDDEAIATFEGAVEAVVNGDLAALRSMLRQEPRLARARSSRRHNATLLHYLGANGVEGTRQRTPPNAVDIMQALLEAGAEVDALAELYDAKCTTMSLLLSSEPPARAGLQSALAETLLDHGAALEGPVSNGPSPMRTALTFGYLATAQALVKRGARVEGLVDAAGLGRRDDVVRLLPAADAPARHIALSLAAQLGHADVVRLLLDAGEDPNRYNLEGYHAHSTPLHQAVWGDHLEVVRLLVERGARLDLRDTLYDGTPLDWAVYGQRTPIAEYLRGSGAPDRASRNP